MKIPLTDPWVVTGKEEGKRVFLGFGRREDARSYKLFVERSVRWANVMVRDNRRKK